jgi:hypothetical protein
MTKEELIDALKYVVYKCDLIINNKNYTPDMWTNDNVEDIAETCNMILDGKYGELLEN